MTVTYLVGPIRKPNRKLAFCTNDAMLRTTSCNWTDLVWCPNPFYVMRCPRCNSRIALVQA